MVNKSGYSALTRSSLLKLEVWKTVPAEIRHAVDVVSQVLPFKANRYVVENLIDWNDVPDDPIFQLVFPQRGMLEDEDFAAIEAAMTTGFPSVLQAEVERVRAGLNPHPAGQMTLNVPSYQGVSLEGAQHKYPETLLFFPSAGQTCHAYCTFCFRWPQFVGTEQQRFRAKNEQLLLGYLKEHREITDLLLTGGDPMVMSTSVIARYIDQILDDPELDHLLTIRIGTKALAYWPQRFVSDVDADDLLRLFERIIASGRTLSIQAHASHPRELEPPIAREAIARVRSTGALIRLQSPCIRHVNDDPDVWRELWTSGVRLGCIPYYFFVERDTGARRWFDLPLVRCHQIFRDAYSRVSGMARTVRGPSMSATPGKVHILGTTQIGKDEVFILQYLQCRRPELVRRPFLARFDPAAVWFDQLQPYSRSDASFFPEYWAPEANRSMFAG